MVLQVEAIDYKISHTASRPAKRPGRPNDLSKVGRTLSRIYKYNSGYNEGDNLASYTSKYLRDPAEFFRVFLLGLQYEGMGLTPSSPPNMLIPLRLKESLQQIWNATDKLAKKTQTELSFGNLWYNFSPMNDQDKRNRPSSPIAWTFFSLLRDQSTSTEIPGPLMVSFNHRVLANPDKTESHKRDSLMLELYCYLIEYGGLVLGIPTRSKDSITHKLLMEYNPVVAPVSWEQSGNVHNQTLYVVSWQNIPEKVHLHFDHLKHPVAQRLRENLQLLSTPLQTPGLTSFTLRAESAAELTEKICSQRSLINLLTTVLEQNSKNISALLQPWLELCASNPIGDQHTVDWMTQQLDKQSPLTINFELPEYAKSEWLQKQLSTFTSAPTYAYNTLP